MCELSILLQTKGIASIIPGLVDFADEFAKPENVTLTTVYRVKGNEASIVYIVSFDSLYDYVNEVSSRNMAFASISRSKGWMRISGIGHKMERAVVEINTILEKIPYFEFTVPQKETIARNLDPAESTRRRQQLKNARETVRKISQIDDNALKDVYKEQGFNDEQIETLIKILRQKEQK